MLENKINFNYLDDRGDVEAGEQGRGCEGGEVGITMIGLEPGPSSSLSFSLFLYLFESGLSAVTACHCGVGELGGGEAGSEPGADAPFAVALAGDELGEGGVGALGGESTTFGNFVENIFSDDFCNNNNFESAVDVAEFNNSSVCSFISSLSFFRSSNFLRFWHSELFFPCYVIFYIMFLHSSFSILFIFSSQNCHNKNKVKKKY